MSLSKQCNFNLKALVFSDVNFTLILNIILLKKGDHEEYGRRCRETGNKWNINSWFTSFRDLFLVSLYSEKSFTLRMDSNKVLQNFQRMRQTEKNFTLLGTSINYLQLKDMIQELRSHTRTC